MLKSISSWHSPDDTITQNTEAARVFAILLCTRVFILKKLLEHIPPNADVMEARRRWVFLQVLPPRHNNNLDNDIFAHILLSLRCADTAIMQRLCRKMLTELTNNRKDLFPVMSTEPLFLVIDEAQVPADQFKQSICSHVMDIGLRPIVYQMYRFFQDSNIFRGIILAGTALSVVSVSADFGSHSAKGMGKSQVPHLFTDTGLFRADHSQEIYIRQYLDLSEKTISNQRLVDRMQHWFFGRCVWYPR
jgi:hypothetical protein